MAQVLRPAASEVRSMLHKIKMDNMTSGRAIAAAAAATTTTTTAARHDPPGPGDERRLELQSILWLERHSVGMRRPRGPFSAPKMDLAEFLGTCRSQLSVLPPPVQRRWKKRAQSPGGPSIRVFQWNVLSQTLGTKNDNFSRCPDLALAWTTRSFRILEEIARHAPDVICLQEVDHFPFLLRSLSVLGYLGRFMPKPDSPCVHVEGNTGPDGCAIFYKRDRFRLKKLLMKNLDVWGVQSNQIMMAMMLHCTSSNSDVVVASTHLKARKGELMRQWRNEQGKDVLESLTHFADAKPIICSGDFNADPDEPIHATIEGDASLRLSSVYKVANDGKEPTYTSWKYRGDVEHKDTLDYIYFSRDQFKVHAVLEPQCETEVDKNLFPNLAFPSDHISLVADLTLE